MADAYVTPEDVIRDRCDVPGGITSEFLALGLQERDGWDCNKWDVTLRNGAEWLRTDFYTGTATSTIRPPPT